MIDIDKLLEPSEGDNPCGENLDEEVSFYTLEELTKGKPQVSMGDSVKPAEPPDWKAVEKQAVDIFSQTKDLRITIWLINALLSNAGFQGLKEGFDLLHKLVDQYWDNLNPELDPSDKNPALSRNSAVMALNEDSFLKAVMNIPLVKSRAIGIFSFRDVEIASGNIKAPEKDTEPPKMTTIDAAFIDKDVKVEELQEVAESLSGALEHISATDQLISTKIGAENSPNISKLLDLLKKAKKFLSEQLLRRGVGVDQDLENGENSEDGNATSGNPVVTAKLTGVISSREDVITALERICSYYDQHEPSSPIPLLLDRAKRLVPKNFMEVLEDLTPAGAKQASELLKSPE